MKPTLIICFLIILFSCHEKTRENKNIDKTESAQRKTKPPSVSQDSLIINQPAAIFFEPDSAQFQNLKSITAENVFETNVHESFFQFKTAKSFLQQHMPAVKILSAKNFRYLVFPDKAKTADIIDLDKIADSWGLYFFEPGKEPRLIDIMSIDTEAPNYFSK